MKRTLWALLHQGNLIKVGYYEDLKKYGDDLDLAERKCNCSFEYEMMPVEEYQANLMLEIRTRVEEFADLNDQLIEESARLMAEAEKLNN